jgi:hypothetical protein
MAVPNSLKKDKASSKKQSAQLTKSSKVIQKSRIKNNPNVIFDKVCKVSCNIGAGKFNRNDRPGSTATFIPRTI